MADQQQQKRSQTYHTSHVTTEKVRSSVHDVPVQKLDFSVFDQEFGSSRDKFDTEMKRMETEMNKLRADFFVDTSSRQHGPGGQGMLMDSSPPQQQLGSFPSGPPSMQHGPPSTGGVQSTVRSEKTVTRTTTTSQGTQSETDTQRTQSFSTGPAAADSDQQLQLSLDSPDEVWKNFMHNNPSSPLIQEEGTAGDKQLRLRFDVHDYKPEEIQVKTVDNKLCVHAKHEEKSEAKQVFREFNKEFMLPETVDPESLRSSLSKDGVLTVQAPLALENVKSP